MLVDTHCHIHEPEYPQPLDETITRAHAAGVTKMICVGTSVRSSRQAMEAAEQHDSLFAAIGVHPHDAKDGVSEIAQLAKLAMPKVVAVGEIGLDYHYNNSPADVQIAALEEQLQVARDYNLPVIFHVRSAFDEFWPVFANFSGTRGVLHSFTDSVIHLQKALQHDLYIGVNGISTFTKDTAQQEMFLQIPFERLLLETDAPFLTPSPFRGKMNEPSMVREVAKQYATRCDVSLTELAAWTTRNAEALFGI